MLDPRSTSGLSYGWSGAHSISGARRSSVASANTRCTSIAAFFGSNASTCTSATRKKRHAYSSRWKRLADASKSCGKVRRGDAKIGALRVAQAAAAK